MGESGNLEEKEVRIEKKGDEIREENTDRCWARCQVFGETGSSAGGRK
jgi:hypothetical protein